MAPLNLTTEIVTRGDLHRLMRELDSLNDFFVGARARSPGTPVSAPRTSKQLEQLAANNKRNLLDDTQRQQLLKELSSLDGQAPSLHISFASEPSPKTLQPIVVWLRENIHPQVFLSVGYQPKIAAGCVLRTPNRIIDMSMGAHLQKQVGLLNHLIAGSINGS